MFLHIYISVSRFFFGEEDFSNGIFKKLGNWDACWGQDAHWNIDQKIGFTDVLLLWGSFS